MGFLKTASAQLTIVSEMDRRVKKKTSHLDIFMQLDGTGSNG